MSMDSVAFGRRNIDRRRPKLEQPPDSSGFASLWRYKADIEELEKDSDIFV